MRNHRLPSNPASQERGRHAESLVADMFQRAGWRVQRDSQHHGFRPDLVVRRHRIVYAVEVKAGAEGRSDRLVPLFAQAVLQSSRAAGGHAAPLAIVAAPKIAERAAEQVLNFAELYAPDAAVGVVDFEGLRIFRGPQLSELNAKAPRRSFMASRSRRVSVDLFSDLNQWMLKVLLAPELPERLLSAPREQYRNASQLARAARVSVMSAFRFVHQLQEEGYLHESAPHLSLVRREDLFRRWQASAQRPVKELPMRFVLGGDVRSKLRKMVSSSRACLALFAAADAMKLGLVEGVPPYVYVERIQPSNLAAWKSLQPCESNEPPDVILRQAPTPRSIFRGMIRPEGIAASDVLQVWVDVGAHPSRGHEQADLIRKRVLEPIVGGKR